MLKHKENVEATAIEAKTSVPVVAEAKMSMHDQAKASSMQVVGATEVPPSVSVTGHQLPTKVELYLDDSEIQNLRAHCPALRENMDWLRADIKARGVTDSIKYYVLEDGRNMVLDGYTRIEICNGENLPYKTQKLEFPSRKAAINWFIDSQLKRRNLAALQIAFLNGNRYRAVKQSHGGGQAFKSTQCALERRW
ncbi:MAG: hypothetical protein ABR985_10165 [Methanotrichaceae archaeon]|jgi:hypothetical protein